MSDRDSERPWVAQETSDAVDLIRVRGRLSDARKWFAHRGWKVLPRTTRGRHILQWGADHAWLSSPKNPERGVRNWCRHWAPWLSDSELRQIISYTRTTSNKRWSDDQCAMVLEISVRDREFHRFRFIGAFDDPNYDRRRETAAEKKAAYQRRYRADHSTGRRPGGPTLDLSEEEMAAHKRKQSAESSQRHRAGNSTGRKRGRPKQEVPTWKAAGFNSRRTYQRYIAAQPGAGWHQKSVTKNPVTPLNRVSAVTELNVTQLKCHEAMRMLTKMPPANLRRLVHITYGVSIALGKIDGIDLIAA